MPMGRALSRSLLAMAVLACAPADRDLRLARLAAEERALLAQLDTVEERLVVNHSRLRFWQATRERSTAAAGACAVEEPEAVMADGTRRGPSSDGTSRLASTDGAAGGALGRD